MKLPTNGTADGNTSFLNESIYIYILVKFCKFM